MEVQDRTVEVRTGILPERVTASHYGMAIASEERAFVRFVNAVLEEVRANDTWATLHDELQEVLPGLPDATPPTPRYRD